MMNSLFSAYMDFWNSFVDTNGRPAIATDPARPPNMPIPAFQENIVQVRVGDKWNAPPFPYITYPIVRTSFDDEMILAVSVWDRTANRIGEFSMVNDVVDQLYKKTPVILRTENGNIVIRVLNFQPMGDESDKFIVRGLLNIGVRSHIV